MKIDNIRLEVADNGFILRFEEIHNKEDSGSSCGCFSHRDYMYKEEVFTDEEIDKAIARMKELKEMK